MDYETIEIEVTQKEQDALKQLARTMRTTRKGAVIRVLREANEAMKKDPSLTPRKAIRLVVSRYVKPQ